MIKKFLTIGVTILFLVMIITSSVAIDYVKKSTIPNSSGNTLYVGGSGEGNYTKIQDAIDDANYGDIVFVYDDSSPYNENIDINKRISLIGENKETTIIVGSADDSVVILSANNTHIQGFTIKHRANYIGPGGISVQSCNNTITENIITDNDIGIYLYQWWENDYNIISSNIITNSKNEGIYLYGSNHNTFIGNTIENSGGAGIFIIYLSNHNSVIDNYISNNGKGIREYDKHGIKIHSCKGTNVVGNTLVSNTDYGIRITHQDNGSISYNTLKDNGGGIYLSYSKNNIVTNNTLINDGFMGNYLNNQFSNNTVNGKPILILYDESDKIIEEDVGQILVYSCSNLTFQNMKINNTTCAIQLGSTENSLITNCTLISNDKLGVKISSSCNHVIINNNLISSDEDGIRINGDSITVINNYISDCNIGIYLNRGGDNNTITGNIITKNVDGIHAYKSHYNNITNNEISYNKFHGLALYNVKYNVISRNLISNNIKGILIKHTLQNIGNLIVSNNFINNLRNAGFLSTWSFPKPMHKWEENYWDNYKGFGSKVILGKFAYFIWLDFYSQEPVWIFKMPWIEFDRNPAKEPYDIKV